ncbi:EAL domain-containing protein [Massilia niabensis]|uniref:EAL domain-containing protein n=1 Tax=Massilia niabensis TaxID=544910 RepID=A0ABW0LBM4_9BURK
MAKPKSRLFRAGVNKCAIPKSALLALLLGLVLTASLFAQVYRLETTNDNIEFSRGADSRVRIFRQRLHESLAGLRSVNQLFATSPTPISREQFREFTLPLLTEQPYVRNFVFHRYVTGPERPAYEAAMRHTYPGFTIKRVQAGKIVPATGNGPFLVVEYIAPLKGNESGLGYDSLSDPVQALARQRAMDTGLVSAARLRPTILPTMREPTKLLAIAQPLYRRGAPLNDIDTRRRAFIGDTMVVFDSSRFVRQIFGHAGLLDRPDTHISVYASAAPVESELVFRHGAAPPAAAHASSLVLRLLGTDALVRVSSVIDIAGTPWSIVVSRDRPGEDTYAGAFLVLAAGILLSLLSAAYLTTTASRSRVIEQAVQQRTTELRATAGELQLRNRAIEACVNPIFITSVLGPDYVIEYVNPAFERTTGYQSADIVGHSALLLQGPGAEQPGVAELMAAMEARREAHTTVRSYRMNGTMYWSDVYVAPVRDENGEVHHFVHVHYDVTDTKRYQEQLEYRAHFDPVTGLANRNLLHDRLQQAISYASRLDRTVWVAFIDLDRFKFVNDSAGHNYGDMLLKVVAGRLNAAVREGDTASRLGGDEFVLVLPQYDTGPMSIDTIEELMVQVAKPIPIGGKEFFVTCSVGIAVYPHDGSTPEALLIHADIAMYRAKEMGRNNFQFFEPALNIRTQARLRIEGGLRKALDRDEFLLNYQPQVDLKTGRIVGAEALIRWQHPELGMVSPIEFIFLTEETGLIVPIGAWVLRTACAQNQAWQRAGLGKLRIAVNVSGIQFAHPNFVQTVAAALQETELDPACLEIELTESVVMHDVERTVSTLHALKTLGVHLSVDDFGTGYSSLAYLKRFPVDVLKIDQSFVRDIATDPDDANIVVSIIALAHSLRLQVIAEGVESAEQLAFLHRHGCDEIQGNHFSRPVTAAAMKQMLQEGKHLNPEHRSARPLPRQPLT